MSIFIAVDEKFFLPFQLNFDHDFFRFGYYVVYFLGGWVFSFFGDLRILKSLGFKDCQILRISKSSNVTHVTFEDIEILRI